MGRASSFLDAHVAQVVGVELGQEPVPASERERGQADQSNESEHGASFRHEFHL